MSVIFGIVLSYMIQTVKLSFRWFNISIFAVKAWSEMLPFYKGTLQNVCKSRTKMRYWSELFEMWRLIYDLINM
jgi:hypothetical protein